MPSAGPVGSRKRLSGIMGGGAGAAVSLKGTEQELLEAAVAVLRNFYNQGKATLDLALPWTGGGGSAAEGGRRRRERRSP